MSRAVVCGFDPSSGDFYCSDMGPMVESAFHRIGGMVLFGIRLR